MTNIKNLKENNKRKNIKYHQKYIKMKEFKLFRLLLALLMGVVMDMLDFWPKLCQKLYFAKHKNDRKKRPY